MPQNENKNEEFIVNLFLAARVSIIIVEALPTSPLHGPKPVGFHGWTFR